VILLHVGTCNMSFSYREVRWIFWWNKLIFVPCSAYIWCIEVQCVVGIAILTVFASWFHLLISIAQKHWPMFSTGCFFSLQYNLVSQEYKLYKKSIWLNLNTTTIWMSSLLFQDICLMPRFIQIIRSLNFKAFLDGRWIQIGILPYNIK
jgi:hypothetical protein